MSEPVTSVDALGPIDYLVVEWPNGRGSGEGFPALLDLVDRGIIRILDLAFVRKADDGSVVQVALGELSFDGDFDVSVFEGVSTGLLDQGDFDDAAAVLDADAVAGILVYENTWAVPFATALRRSGAQLVADARIPVQAILAALDATEPSA